MFEPAPHVGGKGGDGEVAFEPVSTSGRDELAAVEIGTVIAGRPDLGHRQWPCCGGSGQAAPNRTGGWLEIIVQFRREVLCHCRDLRMAVTSCRWAMTCVQQISAVVFRL